MNPPNNTNNQEYEEFKKYLTILKILQTKILIKKSFQYGYDFVNDKPINEESNESTESMNLTNNENKESFLMKRLRP
jgi:hypothetical protein